MMIRRAFIQESGNGRLEPEMRDLLDGLRQRGIPTELFTRKRLTRRQLPLAGDTLVAGDVPTVLSALRQLGIESPPPNDYPRCQGPWLHRRVWTSTVRRLIDDLLGGSGRALFSKPQARKKRFTGPVFATPADLIHLEGASRSTTLLCSDVVRWRSESRAFVIRGEVIGIRHYAGDPAVGVDEEVVARAVRLLEESGAAKAGYGIDFGLLETGETALVEWNDGFSLGSYGLDTALYTELTVARWCELTGVVVHEDRILGPAG